VNGNVLFVGTEFGLDFGGWRTDWAQYKGSDFPAARSRHRGAGGIDLVLATHGRGIWIVAIFLRCAVTPEMMTKERR